jgi:hypothetical protein
MLLYMPVSLPTIVVADSARIGQLLLNYLSAAISRTARGGISITLKVAQQTPTQLLLSFEVLDSSEGFTGDEAQRLKDHVAALTTGYAKEKPDGPTASLSIARVLATAMGGTADIESVGGRARCTAQIPVGRQQQATGLLLGKYRTLVGLDLPAVILVIDSRAYIQHLLGYYLGQWGAQGLNCVSAAEALTVISNPSVAQEIRAVIYGNSAGTNDGSAVTKLKAALNVPFLDLRYEEHSNATPRADVAADAILHPPLLPSTLYNTLTKALSIPATHSGSKRKIEECH